MRPRSRYGRRAGEAGFSLVELLVTVVIMAEILIGVAILFDSSNRLARSQTHLAELQQSLRVGQAEVVRFARMAGIGGLPITRLNVTPAEITADDYDLVGTFPQHGYAVAVRNNIPTGRDIVTAIDPTSGETGDGLVLAGSDVLILRGVFSTPLYYLDTDPPLDISAWDPTGPTNNLGVCVPERARVVGDVWEDYPQDLGAFSQALIDAKAATRPLALILRDTLDPNAYGVMAFDFGPSTVPMLTPHDCADTSFPIACEAPATTANCIRFFVGLDRTTTVGKAYGDLSTGTGLQAGGVEVELDAGPPQRVVQFPNNAGSIGLLEEYRIFVRTEYEVPGVATTRLTPVLSRARFLPGTDQQIDRVDIADNVIDLQIAVGADSDRPGTAGYGDLVESTATSWANDEILFNHTGDTVNPGEYAAPPGAAATWYDVDNLEFHFLRINTLVQSRYPDNRHLAPGLSGIEDFNRGATVTLGATRFNDEFRYHRRWLQTVVELRNLL